MSGQVEEAVMHTNYIYDFHSYDWNASDSAHIIDIQKRLSQWAASHGDPAIVWVSLDLAGTMVKIRTHGLLQ